MYTREIIADGDDVAYAFKKKKLSYSVYYLVDKTRAT